MTNWNGCYSFSILSLNIILLLVLSQPVLGQNGNSRVDTLEQQKREVRLPKPRNVMMKSVMIPGWGQIVNNEGWKVPIIYGMFGALAWNTVRLTNKFKDYKAAAFNAQAEGTELDDMRFGPTPDFLEGLSERFLTDRRDELRNNRDLMFIVLGVAYGLNVLDAYVFAHMKSFDISDDLSADASISPSLIEGTNPGFTLKISLKSKK